MTQSEDLVREKGQRRTTHDSERSGIPFLSVRFCAEKTGFYGIVS